VLEEIGKLNKHIEANPDRFMRLELRPALENVRSQMADFLKVKSNEIIFTINTSMGVDVVLRNLEWEEGDTILACESWFIPYQSQSYIRFNPAHQFPLLMRLLAVLPLIFLKYSRILR